jgi:hypothetical protein
MSNALIFANVRLPAVADLATSLSKLTEEVGGAGGTVILKMDKTGCWIFGADQTEVEDGSTWAVNPYSFVHGHIAWGGDKTPAKGTVLGEVLASLFDPLPETGPSPQHATNGWQLQLGCSLKCVSGEDVGMEARCAFTSTGGKKALAKLAEDIGERAKKGLLDVVPIVELKKDSYQHKAYGKVIVPLFDVKSWMGMEGPAAEPAADVSPVAAEAPTEEAPRRRRRSV